MTPSRPSFFHLTRLCTAALLACALAPSAYADEGDSALAVQSAVTLPMQAKGKPPVWSGRAYRQGVVAAPNPYGAEAGARMLEQGGNAIDAAVAIAYALNVVEPQSAGIGGGGFMMIHLARTGQTFYIDTREKAPAGATRDMFVGVPNSSLQGVAVGVPGMVRGTALALERYGKLTLAQTLAPAIELADAGFAATPRYASESCTSRSQNSPAAQAFFCPNGGGTQGPEVGSLVQNKPLARTLRLIAEHGADCFYLDIPEKGCDIARGIVEGQSFNRPQAPNGKGGSMTLADLANYQPVLRLPVEGTYRGYRIKSMSPPSSGGLTMIQMLKMLERFPIGDASQGFGFGSVKTATVMADAMRIAFADRSQWMGDIDFVPVPMRGLLDDTYVGMRGAVLTPGARLATNPVAGDPRVYDTAGLTPSTRLAVAEPVTGPGETTTHFSVVDQEGNFVAYTNTIESGHGIGVFAGYTPPGGTFKSMGFLLNNELTDFNTTPSTNPFTGGPGFNDVQPNKRPRSSMNPTMIFSPAGEPLVAFGSPGGATIINSVLNVTLNLIDHKMPINEAIKAPRLSVTGVAPNVSVDPGFPTATLDAMRSLGYSVTTTTIGSVQAVQVEPKTGKQYGGADPRREGTVIGLPRSGSK
ncbi:MAG TPA: gamma-glutamyltransferase [Rubrivivax sp.]|nr:gamma-glutamyltransferase [Rubrivivax sp.]